MIVLGGSKIEYRNFAVDAPRFVALLSSDPGLPLPLRKERGLILTMGFAEGFSFYVAREHEVAALGGLQAGARAVILPDDYDYLDDGDVVRFNPGQGAVKVLFRKNSHYNWFLLTERCNNYCLMCSQPPKPGDDSWLVDEVLQTLPLIDTDTSEIGFSGGEPTLLGDDLIRILNATRSWLPRTAVHVLSNGRAFANGAFAEKYASVRHPDLMVGIPIYSDLSHVHDYVVQADGAFDDTIRGILNLKRLGQRVEVRVVIHKQTYERLPELARFLARNLIFVDQVVLMGLEMTGFAKANLDDLWIDPVDYQLQLEEAVRILCQYRMNVSIYNHQLCLLPPSLWPFAKKSISDWKNIYMPECGTCSKKSECGGFFASATLRYSDRIRPFTNADDG